ncbi:hypothetical protein [Parafilimonas terrae]|jgi:CRISPR/Cas system CSM-associated protein Csm2 small subunit|uniref:Uncharacterized protein n=1 Tax=Parafilimonas terrae TaxID=1465490 RepID=A0A1I5ZG44_9BACT|nr:hypothetical protein [Parafilimonas terrae]SFQ55343.1 hypothetical protein SAMN05444277_1246 [Parafilimonas terrae]
MDTILLQVNDEKAYRLIEDLEALNIIKVLKKNKAEKIPDDAGNTARFRGALKLTPEQYNDFLKQTQEMRNEWERGF